MDQLEKHPFYVYCSLGVPNRVHSVVVKRSYLLPNAASFGAVERSEVTAQNMAGIDDVPNTPTMICRLVLGEALRTIGACAS
jgi:hypothetical protein